MAITVTLAGRSSLLDDLPIGRFAARMLPEQSGPPTVAAVRSATAVFTFEAGHWTTEGGAIFNFSPTEAIRFYRHDFVVVGREPAVRSTVK